MSTRPVTLRKVAERALSRAVGAPLIPGNRIRLLKDAAENYPAWIAAIRNARKWIHFESYIIHDDEVGGQFADLLAAKARQGVKVRVVYDWVGSLGNASRRFWRRLERAGIDVRCFNPPRVDSPFGWLSRDHRKMIAIDGEIGYISGLCVGKRWSGYPKRGVDPWRDTGVEIVGPAVADIEHGFADVWDVTGDPLPENEVPVAYGNASSGGSALRVVNTIPNAGSIYRLDQLLAALAQRSIWLSDAYFVGTASYVQALRSAALAGVRTIPVKKHTPRKLRRPSPTETAANVMRLGHTVSAAITDRRELGPAEAVIMVWAAILLIVFSVASLYWPRGVISPIVVISLWIAATLLVRAFKLRGKAQTAGRSGRKVA